MPSFRLQGVGISVQIDAFCNISVIKSALGLTSGLENAQCMSFRGFRVLGMRSRSVFCTQERDQMCSSMTRGIDCMQSPPQGRYIMIWKGSALTIMLIERVLLVKLSISRYCMLVIGRKAVPVAQSRFIIAQLRESTTAVELCESDFMEQASVRHLKLESAEACASTLVVICPMTTLLIPADPAPAPALAGAQ